MAYYSKDIKELESYYNVATKLLEKAARSLTINMDRESDQKRFDALYAIVEKIEADIINLLTKANEEPAKELLS